MTPLMRFTVQAVHGISLNQADANLVIALAMLLPQGARVSAYGWALESHTRIKDGRADNLRILWLQAMGAHIWDARPREALFAINNLGSIIQIAFREVAAPQAWQGLWPPEAPLAYWVDLHWRTGVSAVPSLN